MAQNIWDDAYRNTLQKPGRLEGYLTNDPNCINKLGGQSSGTPLAYACEKGHLEVVTLLISKGARPDVVCDHGRTALFFAIREAPRFQVEIVNALLNASVGPSSPNEVYPEDDNTNALHIAIEQAQDKDIIQALIDAGATPTADNKERAKKKKMGSALQPWKQLAQTLVDTAVNAVSLVISYAGSDGGGIFSAAAKGFIKGMYKVTSASSNPVAADVPLPKTPKEFKKNIDNFVKNSGLDRFFAKKPGFLQALAEKASALRDNPATDLGKPENIKRLTNLSLYQLVIYCDDSGSMGWDSNGNTTYDRSKTRYNSLCQLVSRITHVATSLLPPGAIVKLRFINNTFNGDLTVSDVNSQMARVSPSGGTPLGSSLVQKILKPMVYDRISNPAYEFEQPLLICAITDGTPNSGDIPIKQAVMDCRRALVDKKYDPTSVMFLISQIGTDSGAKAFLDTVRQEQEIKDVVYCTADQLDVKFGEYKDNEKELEVWLLDMLTKPIMRN